MPEADHITKALLRQVRADRRTVVVIAREAGIPRSTLAMALSGGTRSLSLWTAIFLAKFYGYDIALRRRR